MLSYVLVTALLGPASALTLTAGLAYRAWGLPLVVASATLAASVAFLQGRYVARERVTRWINWDVRLRALNTAISSKGWWVLGLVATLAVAWFVGKQARAVLAERIEDPVDVD